MIDIILNYVQTNLVNLGVGTGVIAILLFLLKQGLNLTETYKLNIIAVIKAKIFELVNSIEKSVEGSGLGELKKSKVFTQIMEYVPIVVKLFFNESEINKWIDVSVLDMKLMLGTITQDEYNIEMSKL